MTVSVEVVARRSSNQSRQSPAMDLLTLEEEQMDALSGQLRCDIGF